MVLTTDLTWPTYRQIFHAECRRQGKDSVTLQLADQVLLRQESEDAIAERLIDCFYRYDCDGMFLTSVSSLGGRLPITRVVERVREHCRFVLIDGAQDYCHVGTDVRAGVADLYLAGCHKWLGAYCPLGLAMFGRDETRENLQLAVTRDLLEVDDPLATDPLLQFVEDFQADRRRKNGETVNLSNLFGVAGALRDCGQAGERQRRLAVRQRNADRLMPGILSAGWEARLPHRPLRSGVMLLKPSERKGLGFVRGERLRQRASELGVALSGYDGGMVRLSMPDQPLTHQQLHHITRVIGQLV
jgi:selenocysteine lyase/cysteine desulfurase